MSLSEQTKNLMLEIMQISTSATTRMLTPCLQTSSIYPITNPRTDFSPYQELVYNIFTETLSRAFPLTRETLTREALSKETTAKLASLITWKELVTLFIKQHQERPHPQLWRMPSSFLSFMKTSDSQKILDLQQRFPWLNNLLDFEWAEIELFMAEDPDLQQVFNKLKQDAYSNAKITDTLGKDSILLTNPVHQILNLQYPVWLSLEANFLLTKKNNYHLCLFRKLSDQQIYLLELQNSDLQILQQMDSTISPQSFRNLDEIGKIKEFCALGLVLMLNQAMF